MSRQTLVIGLTGGIGSGKTTVSDFFARLGAPVIDADAIARSLLQPGENAERKVKEEFGSRILDTQGNIDRTILRKLVFADSAARLKLESILHPMVRREILAQIASVKAPYCIVVVPLLLETGYRELVDRILVVDCTQQLQIERASTRDNSDAGQIESIAATQASRQSRLDAADDVVDNSGDIATLEPQILQLDAKYRSLTSKNPGDDQSEY
jgi:dephospho-CoA kinase